MSGILVAYDGSKHAHSALLHAIGLAKDLGLHIVLLNVQLNIERLNVKMFFSHDVIMEYMNEKAQDELKPGIEALKESGIEFLSLVGIGHPVMEILKHAQDQEARFIVMGSRGMGLLSGAVLGSVSYGVLHEAHCPVIIVPEQKAEPA